MPHDYRIKSLHRPTGHDDPRDLAFIAHVAFKDGQVILYTIIKRHNSLTNDFLSHNTALLISITRKVNTGKNMLTPCVVKRVKLELV